PARRAGADHVRHDVVGDRADQGRQASRAGGDIAQALARIAGRPHARRGRFSRTGNDHVVRRVRTCRNAQGCRPQVVHGDHDGAQVAGRAKAHHRTCRRAWHADIRRIRRTQSRRLRALRQTDPRGRGQIGMTATIALVAGDPAGIGPELVTKILVDPTMLPDARIRLIAQRASMDAAARSSGVALDLPTLPWTDAAESRAPIARLEWEGWNAPAFAPAQATAANGAFMLDSLRLALDLAQRGKVDAICFAPLNKAALRAGGMTQEDELRWFADVLQYRGACGEFNVLENLWTSRVTSHVPLKDV